MTMRGFALFTVAAGALLLTSCGSKNDKGPLTQAPAVPLVNAAGEVIGEIRGGDGDNGAILQIDARSLPPGVHGIHIHDIGICEGPGFESAGPHWNPSGKQHGGENPNGAHMGDLQNVTVGPDGTLKVEIVVPGTFLRTAGRNVAPGARQILDASGAAVVIHAQPDDYKTDPSGNSGPRIACAVLGEPQAGAVTAATATTNAAGEQANAVANSPAANAVANNMATVNSAVPQAAPSGNNSTQ
jgi:Cu-Zn family superoxide dismutase